MTGVKSRCRRPQQHGEGLLVTMPPNWHCRPAWHTKHCSRPLFPRTERDHAMIHASEASALYASQTARQARHHRDNHDSTRCSCVIHRATYVRIRCYSIKEQGSLLQQWHVTNYRARVKALDLPSQEKYHIAHTCNPAFPLHL
jgi:hypothetical protein